MRVAVLGGTRFVGRALVRALIDGGHEPLIVHRGKHEASEFDRVPHLHCSRSELPDRRTELHGFRPDAVVDMSAMTGDDAQAALAAAPEGVRLVVASSIDVYRAYESVWHGRVTDPVPLREESTLRDGPPPDRRFVMPGYDYDPSRYENLDVEREYLAAGGTVCRLPMIYGEHDYLRREEFILRRVRAGRRRILVGAGNWLWSRGYAPQLAEGIMRAMETPDAAGEAFNLCEQSCAPMSMWIEGICRAADWDGALVAVPDSALPEDLEVTAALGQHWLADAGKAAERLGWRHADPSFCVEASVRWHIAHQPPAAEEDFSADDAALAAGRS